MADNKLNTNDFINQIFSFRDQMLSSMRDVVDAADDMKKVIGTDLFDVSDVETYVDGLKDLFKEMTDFSRQIEGRLASDRVKDFKLFIKLQKTLFDEILEDIANSKALDEVTKTFKQPFEEMFDSFTDSAKSLPFVGDIIYDRMGVEDIRKKLTSDLSSAFAEKSAAKAHFDPIVKKHGGKIIKYFKSLGQLAVEIQSFRVHYNSLIIASAMSKKDAQNIINAIKENDARFISSSEENTLKISPDTTFLYWRQQQ